ncbi:MAG: hypothetical protein K6E85_07505 [Lachnospiraceae bacterium]|nr:hypothetical protein [Lachnospiraceae bacterium]
MGVHRAQAMCYAYIFAHDNDCGQVGVRMTYCNRETEDAVFFTETFGAADLKEWFDKLVNEYAKWAAWEIKWRKMRGKAYGLPV